MKFVKMFLALVGLAVLFVFVRDNTGKVVVKFWDYATPEIELFLVLIITFVLGMIAASFGSTLKIMQLKRQLKNAGTPESVQKKNAKKPAKKKEKQGAPVPPAPVQQHADEVGVGGTPSGAATEVENAGAGPEPISSTEAAPGAEASRARADVDAAEGSPQSVNKETQDSMVTGEPEVHVEQADKKADEEEAIILPAQGVEDRK